MKKTFYILYSIISYAIGFASLVYAMGFIGGIFVPKHIDNGVVGTAGMAVIINATLIAVFCLQHSGMARPSFKRWWTQFVPKPIERSTYVLASGIALFALYELWRPIPDIVWHVENATGAALLWATYAFGWAFLLAATFVIDHFELMGLKQPFRAEQDEEKPVFVTRLFYKGIRHPIMTGWLILIWATPFMTMGHFLFAAASTVYILVAIQLEERNLIETFGDTYKRYIREVPMLVPSMTSRRGKKTERQSGIGKPVTH